MYYTAPLYLGPNRVRFNLLYDTGSPEVTLGVNTCTGCKGTKYDPSAGEAAGTFEWTTDSRTITYYDGTQYTGKRCKETTCPINDASTCMTKFQFLCIQTSNDTGTLDGILGLGRAGTSYNGEHYVDKLFAANRISQKKFSISLDTTTRDAFIDYGPPDTSQWQTGQTPTYIKMYGNINPYWQAIADGFYFSDATKTKYTFKQTLGIVDSGWTALSGPSNEIKFIKDWITRNMVGVKVDANGYTSFSCASYYSTLPSVYIRLGGYWIQMLPEDYVIKLGTDSCTLLITVNEDFWALGMTVMRGYYVIFDVQNDQVGFVPQNDSKKTAIVQDVASSTSPTPLVQPATDDDGKLSMTTTALYAVVVILLIVIIWLILSPSIATDPTLEEDGSATTFTERAQKCNDCAADTHIRTLLAMLDDPSDDLWEGVLQALSDVSHLAMLN